MVMVAEQQTERPDLDDFIAELTAAAFPIVLRHKGGQEWLDLELDLWHTMSQTVHKWEQRAALPLS
jgi:hypothetical protein